MPRPPGPPLALALALAASTACTSSDVATCPGQPIGTYAFSFTIDTDGADMNFDGVPDDANGDGVPDVISGCIPRGTVPAGTFVPPSPGDLVDPSSPDGPRFAAPFDAVLSTEETTAALCTGHRFASPLLGTVTAVASGEALVFGDLVSDGAALTAAQCGPRCPVTIVEEVGGLLSADGASFAGYVVDTFDVPENAPGDTTYDCGACSGTCRAVYALAGSRLP